MKATLAETLRYTNHDVILRFQETWYLPIEEVEDLFTETIKWLWLIAANHDQHKGALNLAISQSTKLIDEMWHTFILFTKDYQDFCDRYIGYYLHHRPTPRSEYDATIAEYEHDAQRVIERNRERFAKQYALVYDMLGEATLRKWYEEYLEKYTDDYLRSIWRWSFSPYDSRVKKTVRLAATDT